MKVNNKRVTLEIEVASLHSLDLILRRARASLADTDVLNTVGSEAYSDSCRLLDEIDLILNDSSAK